MWVTGVICLQRKPTGMWEEHDFPHSCMLPCCSHNHALKRFCHCCSQTMRNKFKKEYVSSFIAKSYKEVVALELNILQRGNNCNAKQKSFKVKKKFIDVKPIKSGWRENDVAKLLPQGGIHLYGESKRKEHQNQSFAVSSGAAVIELPRQTQSRRETKLLVLFGVQA